MDLKKIGEKIAKKRKEKNLTQEQLGERLGVGGSSVSKWERGVTAPDISLLGLISKELDINLDDLLIEKSKISNKQSKKKIRNIMSFIVTIFLLVIISFLFINKFFSKDKVFIIYSNNSNVSFSGHIMIGKNKSVLTINNFRLLENTNDINIYYYKLELKNQDNVVCEYYSDDVNGFKLSNILEESFLEIISTDEVEKIIEYKDLNNLQLFLEYIDNSNEINRINLDFIIEKQ